MMKTGYLRNDDSGHNYIIPAILIKSFDAFNLEIEKAEEETDEWYYAIEKFETLYGKYRVDDISNKSILMED